MSHLPEFLGWEECVIAHSILFSNPYMAGLGVQYSLHAMLLGKVFIVPPFFQFLVYAVTLHSCSYIAHIKVLWGHRRPVHCAHPVQYTLWRYCPLSGLFTFFHWCFFPLIGFEKSYKMTFRRQEKSRKIPLVGQSHLRNP